MPILDLAGAAPLYPKVEAPARKRSLSSANTPAATGGNGGQGGFAAAKINRLTMDFIGASRSADQDLFGDNIRLRGRARKLAVDNPFARKFLAMVVQNVVGPAGILLQAKVTNQNGKSTADTKRINGRIEEEWKRWCKVGRCTADGRFSFAELQQMAIKNIAREGENLIKYVYGRDFNETGFSLQPLDNDQLDDSKMVGLPNGGAIRMGVEVNQFRRPIAYYLWNGHPNDTFPGTREQTRVPAELINHTAVWERPAQTRGYTWMTASILSLNMYGGYTEAELVAARASAAKFLVIQQKAAEGYIGDDEDEAGDDTNTDGTQMMTANAGEALVLDPGQEANFIDPKHPTQAFRDFTRTTIRNIASGLLVSYPSLANDLEGVNFSSIRAGLLDERDGWRIIQRWFIDHFLEPIFQNWLRMAELTVLSDLSLSAAQREMIVWKARGWEWVDPLKDAQAIILKLQNNLITYTDALSQLGLDFEEVTLERANEQAFIEALGLKLGTDIRGIADTASDDQASADDKSGGKNDSARAIDRVARALDLFVDLKRGA